MTGAHVLRSFARVWVWLVALLVLVSLAGAFVAEPTVWQALATITEWYSPFNLVNYAVLLVLLAPAFAAYAAAERLERRPDTRQGARER